MVSDPLGRGSKIDRDSSTEIPEGACANLNKKHLEYDLKANSFSSIVQVKERNAACLFSLAPTVSSFSFFSSMKCPLVRARIVVCSYTTIATESREKRSRGRRREKDRRRSIDLSSWCIGRGD